MTRYSYDAYGNQTVHHQLADSGGSATAKTKTLYDDFYHLFPVTRRRLLRPRFCRDGELLRRQRRVVGREQAAERRWAYWGAMSEWCDINDVCVRQAYDVHGRRMRRWETLAGAQAWPSLAQAAVQWVYDDPLSTQGTLHLNDTVITEWRNPRCAGNFVRRHYNGLGQLMQEQRPAQNWQMDHETCTGKTPSLPEVDIDYGYDGLGRLQSQSVPHAVTATWVNRGAWWNEGVTQTRYDALGRVTQTTAPNGEVTGYAYSGRQTQVTGVGRNGYPNKVLQWTQTDGLGHLRYVRTASSSGAALSYVALTHDVLGNLSRVTQRRSGRRRRITYDLGGRKTAMTDPDLGTWSYSYNRQGQLQSQTDACGNVTALRYDEQGRLAQETATPGSDCQHGGRRGADHDLHLRRRHARQPQSRAVDGGELQ
ncbi:MAG: hypothetical protein V9G12_10085 [Microthrixaceae bacterium]